MTAHDLASALGAIPRGKHWLALCPVHEADGRKHQPSLKISEGRSVPVLVKCWAGCENRDIIRQLRQQGLWRKMPTLTPQQRRRYAQELSERDAKILDLIDWLKCLDRLKLHVDPSTPGEDGILTTWEVLCREQHDVMRQIEELRNPKPTEQPLAMVAKAG